MALVLLCAVVIAAGVLAGWRVSIQFVRVDVEGRGIGIPSVSLRLRPVALPHIAAILGPAPIVPSQEAPLAVGSSGPASSVPQAAGAGLSPQALSSSAPSGLPARALAGQPPGSVSAPAVPQPFSGLHVTFQREWKPVAYEIGSPTQKPPVRLVCGACPAVNWALRRPTDQSGDRERVMVNAATFGAIMMAGNGKITLVEWDP